MRSEADPKSVEAAVAENDRIDDIVARADDLNDRIDNKTALLIADLVNYKQRATRWQRITIAALSVMVVMIAIGTIAIVKIAQNATSIRDACEAQNVTAAGEIRLWRFVLDIPPRPDETEGEKQNKRLLADLVTDTFPTLDCSAAPRILP